MLRRLAKAYRAWDDQTYKRLTYSRWTPVFAMTVLWVCVLLIPWLIWRMRGISVRASNELVVIGVACSVLGGVLGTVALHRHSQRRLAEERRRAGLCERRGYDLRNSYYYCPECGLTLRQ